MDYPLTCEIISSWIYTPPPFPSPSWSPLFLRSGGLFPLFALCSTVKVLGVRSEFDCFLLPLFSLPFGEGRGVPLSVSLIPLSRKHRCGGSYPSPNWNFYHTCTKYKLARSFIQAIAFFQWGYSPLKCLSEKYVQWRREVRLRKNQASIRPCYHVLKYP